MRSRAYPAVDLKTAIQLVNRLVQALGPGAQSREAIAQSLGHAKSSGPAARKIAAMNHFGLLEKSDKLYRPTDLAKALLRSDQEQLNRSRKEAFLNPTLFREVFDAYRTQGAIPSLLGHTLAQSHGISENVQEEVASIFRDSGIFAGVLTPEGEFVGPRPAHVDPARDLSSASEPDEARSEPGATETQSATIQLKYGEAQLVLPTRLTSSDFRRLKALLEVYAPDLENQEPRTKPNLVPMGGKDNP